MAKTKQQKSDDLSQVTEKLQGAKSAVLVGYRGTTVKDLDKYRRSAEKQGIFTKVYKITLIRKALESIGIDVSTFDYKQPVIIAISSEDETAAAKHAKETAEDIKTLEIISGYLDGKIINAVSVKALAAMPGKQELRGQLVRVLNAPATGIVNSLAGNLRGLVQVLNARATK